MAVVEVLAAPDAPLLARPFYIGGDPGPITATMAHVPELLETALPFIGAALGASALDFRTKEIVIVRTSALLMCRYCIDSHSPVALDAGVSLEQVRALRNEAAVETAFPLERDRALIAWIDAVAVGPGPLRPGVTESAKLHFSDAEIVELTLVVGVTLLLNRYATSLQLPVDDQTLKRLASEGLSAA
jgi:AhpD family alkylhydroperoxidase